ncbi:IS66 family transposase zinc-finger binding domain-containing protein [Nostoc sp.]
MNPLYAEKRPEKKKSGKKRLGQAGHKGHSRLLYELSECESVLNHHPETCRCCGEILLGEDANPYRHQIVEIPPIKPIIVEHRLHQLMCQECGTLTRATLPVDVYPSGYGVRVVALVSVLSGLYRHSTRMVQSAMQDIFGITMSLGTDPARLLLAVSELLAESQECSRLSLPSSLVVLTGTGFCRDCSKVAVDSSI